MRELLRCWKTYNRQLDLRLLVRLFRSQDDRTGTRLIYFRSDPSEFILEHYVDGGLVDNTFPTQRSAASKNGIHIWGVSPHIHMHTSKLRVEGPDLPVGFLD